MIAVTESSENPNRNFHLIAALDLLGDLTECDPVPLVNAENDQILIDALQLCEHTDLLKNEPIRTVHHLSCTGGTLISKCIASMPNVLVLNEINPHSTMLTARQGHARFTPTDTIALHRQGDPDTADTIIDEVFQAELEVIRRENWKIGRRVVLRDHSHSYYLADEEISKHASVYALASARFPVKSILTVRNPVDSWLSMKRKGWHSRMVPSSFDEYCRRYIEFLREYRTLPIVKYEQFVKEPNEVMRQVCQYLELEYDDEFQLVYDSFEFSGDSGRGGSVIKPPKPRERSPEILAEAATSDHFRELLELLAYEQ